MNLKVAHICTSKLSYRILDYKLSELKKLGYEVHIISSNDCKVDESIIKDSQIIQHYIEMDREVAIINDLKSICSLYKLLKKERFDIVHTHTAKAGIIGRIAAYLCGTPIIIHTSHGVPFYEGMPKIKYYLYRFFETIGGKLSTFVGSQNLEDLENLKEVIDNQKLYYEGNGVDLESIDIKSRKITNDELIQLRKNLKIKSDEVIIFMGARFESIKNHKMLIDVLEDISFKKNIKFKCILAGDGPLHSEILESIEDKNLNKCILLLGHVTDVEKYICLSDIVVLTSVKEGIPRILMESMVLEKPIVATNVKGTKELVVNMETGLLSELGDIEQMVNHLCLLISDKEKRSDMGKRGKKRIENNFTEKIVAKRISDIYQLAYRSKYKVFKGTYQ